jgi:DNA-binding transcriptional LysR family regulator
MRYTLRQLQIFVETARDGSFARAADRLGVSQPAVSDHVRALERNLGAQLFLRRRGATSVLTADGERLRVEAQRVLEQSVRLDARAAGPRTVTLRLFAGQHIFDRMLRAGLPGFHRLHPGIALDIVSDLASEEVPTLMDRGELDLAVFTATGAHIPQDAEVLGEVPCAVAASRRLVGDAVLTPQQIARLPFVLPLPGTPAARWVEAALAGLGLEPRAIAARTQFLDVQQAMVEAGEAAALLFREAVDASPARRELRLLSPEVGGLLRALVIRRGAAPQAEAVADFVRRAVRS